VVPTWAATAVFDGIFILLFRPGGEKYNNNNNNTKHIIVTGQIIGILSPPVVVVYIFVAADFARRKTVGNNY